MLCGSKSWSHRCSSVASSCQSFVCFVDKIGVTEQIHCGLTVQQCYILEIELDLLAVALFEQNLCIVLFERLLKHRRFFEFQS
jgi:hypothetical protein